MLRKKEKKRKQWTDYVFCLIVGSMFLFALTRTIFSATVITIDIAALYTFSLVAIVLFLILTYNLVTRIVAGSAVLMFGLYTLNVIFRHPPYRPDGETFPRLIEHFYQVVLMAVGQIPYEQALGRTAVWLTTMALGFIVVIFMFHIFSFYVLALTGIAVFALTWSPGFHRDDVAFLIFLFAIVVVLIRKMNRSVSASLVIVPICALVVFFSQNNMPTESNAFVRRPLTQFVSETIEDISDWVFELFNPTYFSFATTGFTGRTGTLGGPVNPNSRPVMEVMAPAGTYLAGATHNIYTGNRWISNLEEGDIYTHGLPPGHFEMLETIVSLLRGATVAQTGRHVDIGEVRNLFRTTPVHDVTAGHFTSLGITYGGGYFLHSYMPVTMVNINLGRRRTGTVFRPSRAWDLVFVENGGNYLEMLNILPTGDIQTPRLMSRDTGYQMQFLNVNSQLPFVEYLLRQSGPGVYTAMRNDRHVTFYGAVAGLLEPPHFMYPDYLDYWFDIRGYREWRERQMIYERYRMPTGNINITSAGNVNITQTANINENEQVVSRFYWQASYSSDQMLMASLDFSEEEIWELLAFAIEVPTIADAGRTDFRPAADFVAEIITEIQRTTLDFNTGVREMQMLVDMLSDGRAIAHVPSEASLLGILDAFTANVLVEYARQVRAHFMYVPESVPQRVHDLTHEVIRGADNDFDRVMAIRDYLLQFPYTLNTVPVPRDVCFVDHFLFEGQQGYCVYFASAMAIMARIAGVPSRYVEGFVSPATLTYRELTLITNMMAHAWAEVYLEGFGWLMVEATPTYAHLLQAGFPLPAQAGRGLGGAWDYYDYDWLRYQYYEEMARLIELGQWAPVAAWVDGANGNIQGRAAEERIRINPLIFVIGIPALGAAVLVAFALSRFIKVSRGLKRVRALDPSGQIIEYFAGVLDMIEYFAIPMAGGETPLSYGKHQGKRFAFRSDSVTFGNLIDLYYKARYSQKNVTEAERALMEEAYFDMVGRLKWFNNKRNYLKLRYIERIGAIGLKQKPGDQNVTLQKEKVTI